MDASSEEIEIKKKNFKAVTFITESCFKLRLDSVTLASACVLYHRFFRECSVEEYDNFTIAATCIFLSTKVEEQHTRLRDVVNVCHRGMFPNKPLLDMNKELWDFKDTISNCELHVLRVLNFHVTCDHPHKYLLHYLMSLSQLFNERDWNRHPVPQTAWGLLRDSYHGTVCLDYKPQLIAISCIYLSLLICKTEVPLNKTSDTEWWKVFLNEATQEEINDVINDIVDIYNLDE